MKVKVVSAYVPLLERTRPQFVELSSRLTKACGNKLFLHWDFPFRECWLAQEPGLPWKAANARALDRFETDDEHICSNIVQHSCTQWAMLAAEEEPDVDVWIWLGASILKQGAWRNNPVTEAHVFEFIRRVGNFDKFDKIIPFPGIEPPKPISDHGDNWRFVGSTHIWPKKFLPAIHRAYQFECRRFIHRVGAIPLDLAIWPAVEANSALPFQFYQAEYDASQLTGFPT